MSTRDLLPRCRRLMKLMTTTRWFSISTQLAAGFCTVARQPNVAACGGGQPRGRSGGHLS